MNGEIRNTFIFNFLNFLKGYGFILYTVILDDTDIDQKTLSIPGIRDRAYIQIGSTFLGILYRVNQTSLKINLKNNKDNKLRIIVENMGRLNFGFDMLDAKVRKKNYQEKMYYRKCSCTLLKGILSEVKLDEKILNNWSGKILFF